MNTGNNGKINSNHLINRGDSMTNMTKDELEKAIHETEIQEHLFELANDHMSCAYWILERVKLRGQLYSLLLGEAFR